MTKEEFLELTAKRYEDINTLQEEKSFYEYEKKFDQIWTGLGKDVLEHSIGEVPKDRRKKTFQTRYGKIEIAKPHPFSQKILGSRTSPLLQEYLVLMGCEHVYNDVPGLLKRLLGIEVSTSKVYRSCLRASEAIDQDQLQSPSGQLADGLDDPEATVYGQVDGSMLQTDDGWQEVKLGRVFTSKQLQWQGGRMYITSSDYVAKRGHYHGFTDQFEKLMPSNCQARKVFITDGADWIHRWLKAKYPGATLILDFFHVAEKLGDAARLCHAPTDWYKRQRKRLKEGKAHLVIKAVKQLDWPENPGKGQLLNYLEKNRERMHYDQYLGQGLLIGSGAIESAHRTFLQVRMKRSGQRWGEPGADKMIDLRTAVMSGKSHLVSDICSGCVILKCTQKIN